MKVEITPNQLVSIVHRLIHLLTWALFAVFHTALLAIALLVLYLSDIKGSDIYNYILSLGQNVGLQKAWKALSVLGVSGLALLSIYATLVKKLFVNYSTKYLFKNIDKHNIQ